MAFIQSGLLNHVIRFWLKFPSSISFYVKDVSYQEHGFNYIGKGYHPWEEESRIYGINLKNKSLFLKLV